MYELPESEWKILRELRPVALDRLCARILAESRAVIDDPSKSNHERYLALFALIQDRDDDIAVAFNDVRRSNALGRLAAIVHQDLLTDLELQRFGKETRERVDLLTGKPES